MKNKNLLEAPIKIKNQEQINENLSWAGKLFFAGVGAYIGNEAMKTLKLPIKIKGTPEQIKIVVDMIFASKKFQEEINKPGASIENVMQKLQLKNTTKSNFEEITKQKWPL